MLRIDHAIDKVEVITLGGMVPLLAILKDGTLHRYPKVEHKALNQSRRSSGSSHTLPTFPFLILSQAIALQQIGAIMVSRFAAGSTCTSRG